MFHLYFTLTEGDLSLDGKLSILWHALVLPCHVCATALSMEGSQIPDHYAGRGPGGMRKSKFLKRRLCPSCAGLHFTEPTVQIFNVCTVFPSLYRQPDTFTFNTSAQIFCAKRAEATFTLRAWHQVLRGFKACKYLPLLRVRVLFFSSNNEEQCTAGRSGRVQRLTATQMHWEEWTHTDVGVFVISVHQFTSLISVHKLFHSRKRLRAKCQNYTDCLESASSTNSGHGELRKFLADGSIARGAHQPSRRTNECRIAVIIHFTKEHRVKMR